MADDLQGLGTVELFPLLPNWVINPSTNFVIGRYYQTYPGSSMTIEQLTEDVPQVLELGFLLEDKADEYTIIDFFNEHKGRLGRFWLKDPKQSFILKEDANTGSSVLVCEPNRAEDVMRGDERIWIEMGNGDILTRELTSVDYSEVDDATTLSLDTSVDRDLLITPNYLTIAKLLLVRLDYDTLQIKCHSNVVGETSFKFRELPKEYIEV